MGNLNRPLKMGMVGGGIGSFMGDVHRKASGLDGMIELVCGAFNSSLEKTIASGKALYLPEDRCYGSYQEMIEKELFLDFVKYHMLLYNFDLYIY